jgi:hypothetical protein
MIALALALVRTIHAADPAPAAAPAAEAAPAAPTPAPAPPPVPKLHKPVPPSLEESAWDGTTLTAVTCAATMEVDNKGRVKTVTLQAPETCPGAFGTAVLAALKTWQFVPALDAGRPVPSTYATSYEFRKAR